MAITKTSEWKEPQKRNTFSNRHNQETVDAFKQFLQKISPITDEEFADTLRYFEEQQVKRAEIFVKPGYVCRHIAFIVQGTLRAYYINENGEETTSCFCTANNLTTSYKSFILQEPSNLIVEAIEDTQLLIISFENLQKLYAQSVAWQTIGRVVAEREYIVMEHYASVLNNETAKEKYLRLLAEQPNVLQKAKMEDVASYLGITRRTLSRIRREMSK